MIKLQKTPGKDFVILNLTDLHIRQGEDVAGGYGTVFEEEILRYTLDRLLERVKPDLITITGDISQGKGFDGSYRLFMDMMEATGIPWAPVWGNHDNGDWPEYVDEMADRFLACPHCLFEKGDPALGNGNYVIAIMEGEKTLESLIMMDSHDYVRISLLDKDLVPKTYGSYASLLPAQLVWYREQVASLREMGCDRSVMMMHIPPYCYREAMYDALEEDVRAIDRVTLEDSYRGVGWKEEYKRDSFGVFREGVGSPDYEDGVLAVLEELGHTRHVLAGHDHINNCSIPYHGIRLSYALKIGTGAYWHTDLNGGTVMTVGDAGVREIHHEYVDASHLWKGEKR
ncbi:MAG: metallophosphoesterase [Clostridia bacterium]|nr:metallophosphoesterase [Clostridia bacterium]